MSWVIGRVLVEGHAARRDGCDFSISLPYTHPTHGYCIPRQVIALWWARRCDAGVFVRGLGEIRVQLSHHKPIAAAEKREELRNEIASHGDC